MILIMKKMIALSLILCVMLTGCAGNDSTNEIPEDTVSSSTEETRVPIVGPGAKPVSTTAPVTDNLPVESGTSMPSNVVPVITDPAVTAPQDHDIVVEEEYIFNDDEEETEPVEEQPPVTTTIYAEDVDHSGPVVEMPDYEVNNSGSTYTGPIDKAYDWAALEKQNSDIMAWLYVPNTNISYPVLQEQTFGEYYYATHDVYHNKIISGGIFTPNTAGDEDAHFLILGHNMKNDTMFGTLDYYKTKSFCSSNPYIYIYYPDRTEKWQVWTAYQTMMDDAVYDLPYQFGSVEYDALIASMDKNKWYETTATKPSINDRTLTLSTCDNFDGEHEGRFIVNAVLVETKELD